MRFFLFAAAFLPVIAFAQGTCYSPSDCAAPLICSSFMDGVFPGVCMEAAEGEVPLHELIDAVPVESSSSSESSVSSSSTSSVPSRQPSLAEVRVLFSASSSVSSDESSSSAEEENTQEEPTGNFFTKAWDGVKSFFCYFFCSEE